MAQVLDLMTSASVSNGVAGAALRMAQTVITSGLGLRKTHQQGATSGVGGSFKVHPVLDAKVMTDEADRLFLSLRRWAMEGCSSVESIQKRLFDTAQYSICLAAIAAVALK